MTTEQLIQTLMQNGPWAVAAAFLGRELLKAWAQDREDLRQLSRETISAIGEMRAAITALADEVRDIRDGKQP